MTTNNTELRVSIASVRDRDELVAELWAGNCQVAELARIDERLILQVFAPDGLDEWAFSYEVFLNALQEMRRELDR